MATRVPEWVLCLAVLTVAFTSTRTGAQEDAHACKDGTTISSYYYGKEGNTVTVQYNNGYNNDEDRCWLIDKGEHHAHMFLSVRITSHLYHDPSVPCEVQDRVVLYSVNYQHVFNPVNSSVLAMVCGTRDVQVTYGRRYILVRLLTDEQEPGRGFSIAWQRKKNVTKIDQMEVLMTVGPFALISLLVFGYSYHYKRKHGRWPPWCLSRCCGDNSGPQQGMVISTAQQQQQQMQLQPLQPQQQQLLPAPQYAPAPASSVTGQYGGVQQVIGTQPAPGYPAPGYPAPGYPAPGYPDHPGYPGTQQYAGAPGTGQQQPFQYSASPGANEKCRGID